MADRKVPSEEDFARASAAMQRNDQGLSVVRERLRDMFVGHGLHEIFVRYSPRTDTFVILVFWEFTRDIERLNLAGIDNEVRAFARRELERVGRIAHNIEVEFDSHENVKKNLSGSYFNRLR